MITDEFGAVAEKISRALSERETEISELEQRLEAARSEAAEAKSRMEAAEGSMDGAAYTAAEGDRAAALKTAELLTAKISSVGDIPTKHELAREVKETADRLRADKVKQAGPVLEQLEAVSQEYDAVTAAGNALLRSLGLEGQYINPWFRDLCKSAVGKYRRYAND
ncbi:MAG: hypothetical protein LUC30_03150 [Clostridiales bacterium]|nr:hypothetical protein [Clostridiales bacterium]